MPLARAAKAATLLVMTDVMIPKPKVNTPAIHAIFGARISLQLRRTLWSRSRETSRKSQILDSPSSRKMMWAVSVAIDEASRREIEILGCLMEIESVLPCAAKHTLDTLFCR